MGGAVARAFAREGATVSRARRSRPSLAASLARSDARGSASSPCANFTPETNPGVPEEALQPLVKDTLLGRLPRLAEVAGAAVFATSEQGGAMTGAVVNLTCGAIVDWAAPTDFCA